MSRAGQFRYYIQLWNAESGAYSVPRSAASVVQELELDEKAFPFTSRTGAFLIGEELRRRGGALPRKTSPLFADYCAEIWNWDSSPYVRGKLARGQSIGRKYVADNLARVENHIRLAFPDLRLAAVKPYMLEDFAMKLKTDSGLGNRSINAILDTMAVPLHEAARLGLLPSDPASTVRKLGNDTREKGIPTEEEVRALLGLSGIDSRIRCAILLGAACALRIGEIQALRNDNIGEKTLTVACSWSNMDGLKSTKTGRVRVVPLPPIVRSALLELMAKNPQGPVGFLMYGLKPDAPLDVRAIERGFYKALEKIGIDEETRTIRALSFHSLRHWSNAMLRGSVSDAKLHLLTGHSTEAMTNRYDHATEADLAELAQAQEAKILPFLADSRAHGTMENAVMPKAAGGEV
jgi:integrase